MRLAAGLWKLLGKSSGFSSHGKLVGGLEPWIFFDFPYIQWPFQVPKLEVPTIYKAYVREYPHKIWPYMVRYLHSRILEFRLIYWKFHHPN